MSQCGHQMHYSNGAHHKESAQHDKTFSISANRGNKSQLEGMIYFCEWYESRFVLGSEKDFGVRCIVNWVTWCYFSINMPIEHWWPSCSPHCTVPWPKSPLYRWGGAQRMSHKPTHTGPILQPWCRRYILLPEQAHRHAKYCWKALI